MNRTEKEQVVGLYKETFVDSSLVIIFHNNGLNVSDMTDLRKKISELGGEVKVTKNTLAKIAIKETSCEVLSSEFSGPTVVACSQDPVAAAKGLVEFAKDNSKIVILSGVLNGEKIDESKINILAKLPSLDELRAKIICTINTPSTRIAGVTQAPAGQLARLLNAYSQKS